MKTLTSCSIRFDEIDFSELPTDAHGARGLNLILTKDGTVVQGVSKARRANGQRLAPCGSWRIVELPDQAATPTRWLGNSLAKAMDNVPAKGIGAPSEDRPMMSNTSPADCALLAQRSNELRLACCALSRSEFREWLQTKHGRQITKERSNAEGKILAICPEFSCIAKPGGSRVVESTAEIDRALAIALFGISDAGNSDVRLALAQALLGLAEHAAGQPIDRNELLDQLNGSLGKLVLSALNTPPALVSVGPKRRDALAKYSVLAKSPANLAHSPREQRRKAELAVQDAMTAIRSALGALLHWKFPSPDKRSTQPDKINLAWLVILTAKQIFREDLRRPRQTEIEEILKEDGYGFNGRGSSAKWREVFRLAGLDSLPR